MLHCYFIVPGREVQKLAQRFARLVQIPSLPLDVSPEQLSKFTLKLHVRRNWAAALNIHPLHGKGSSAFESLASPLERIQSSPKCYPGDRGLFFFSFLSLKFCCCWDDNSHGLNGPLVCLCRWQFLHLIFIKRGEILSYFCRQDLSRPGLGVNVQRNREVKRESADRVDDSNIN